MAFTIPNNDVAGNANQARWFEADIAILVAALSATGVVSGCAVTAQGSPDMTVAVASGTILAAGVSISVASGNLTVGTADATNPRLDLISASATGVKTITAGTAAASPKPPDLPSGHAGLALVYVAANDTAINTAEIIDKRAIVGVSINAMGARVYNSGAFSVGASSETAITFDSERSDSDAFHSTSSNTSRMTVPTGGAGRYTISGAVEWAASALGTLRRLSIRLNGSTYIAKDELTSIINAALPQNVSTIYDLADGDYVELVAFQDTVGAINLQASGNYSPEFGLSLAKGAKGDTGAAASLTSTDATLSGDVTMTTANTFYDGPSVSLATGTWLVLWKVLTQSSGALVTFRHKLWDGSTIYDEAEDYTHQSGERVEVSGFAVITLGSTTSVKISVAGDTNSQTMKRDGGVGTSHTATRVSAVKIA